MPPAEREKVFSALSRPAAKQRARTGPGSRIVKVIADLLKIEVDLDEMPPWADCQATLCARRSPPGEMKATGRSRRGSSRPREQGWRRD